MKIYMSVFIALFIGISSICQAQNNDIPEEVKENVKFRVENGINAGIVVGIITSDGTTYYSYGVKSLKTNELVDENSVFEIGSISKTFTGILLADMVVKGELDLGDVGGSVPTGAVMAFYLASCPTGWSLANGNGGTPDLRGAFIRGDGGEANSRDVARSLGNYQSDEFERHAHTFWIGQNSGTAGAARGWNLVGTSRYIVGSGNIRSAGSVETRPKNVALTYCMKN
jgi:hypothetical protein